MNTWKVQILLSCTNSLEIENIFPERNSGQAELYVEGCMISNSFAIGSIIFRKHFNICRLAV